jgi:hypothetical protein
MGRCFGRKYVKINVLKWYVKNLEVFLCKNFKYCLTLKLPLTVCVYIENMKAPKKWKYFYLKNTFDNCVGLKKY